MWSRPFWCVRRMRPGLVEGCLGRMITASRRMPRLERGKVDLNSARDTLWSARDGKHLCAVGHRATAVTLTNPAAS